MLNCPFSSFRFHLLQTQATSQMMLGLRFTDIHTHMSVLTIHLSFIGEDDLPSAAGRIDGQGLLKALFNVRAPHPLCIIVYGLVSRVAHPLHVLGRALAAAPAAGINRGGWALQAEAWSRLGRDLEFPNNKHSPTITTTAEQQRSASKNTTQYTMLVESTIWTKSSQTT